MVSCLAQMLGKNLRLCLCVLLCLSTKVFGHDIPADVAVQAFLKPEGLKLHYLVRVPLKAMQDIDFPTHGPGYLDLDRVEQYLRDGAEQWISNFTEIREGDSALAKPKIIAARISLESDRSFGSYDQALAHVTGDRLPQSLELYWNQAMLDVLFDYPIASDQSRFSIHPAFERLGLRVITALRFIPPSGAVRGFEFVGDPGLVHLDPSWRQAAFRFVRLGFEHILSGTDHLLFLFCLVIPFRRFRPLVAIVTSFTVAHSITLIASALNFGPQALWFPPLIETLIAASILYMALENITGTDARRRWMITFGFGLVHGFGFSFALRQTLQFAGSHLLLSLLSFNAGVELGQLLVLLLLVPVLQLTLRYVVAERTGVIILSAIVAHTAWHWMVDRLDRLRQFPFVWPALTTEFMLSLVRWSMAAVLLAAIVWFVRAWYSPPRAAREEGNAEFTSSR